MLYENTGGEGVGWLGRYLWCTPHSEKAKGAIWKKEDEDDQKGVSR